MTPARYKLKHVPGPHTTGGGLAVIFKSVLNLKFIPSELIRNIPLWSLMNLLAVAAVKQFECSVSIDPRHPKQIN